VSARVILTCDGHRHGQPCRGNYPIPLDATTADVAARARAAGWRMHLGGMLCPSRGHDEEPDE
jgi:hypothetical protein